MQLSISDDRQGKQYEQQVDWNVIQIMLQVNIFVHMYQIGITIHMIFCETIECMYWMLYQHLIYRQDEYNLQHHDMESTI